MAQPASDCGAASSRTLWLGPAANVGGWFAGTGGGDGGFGGAGVDGGGVDGAGVDGDGLGDVGVVAAGGAGLCAGGCSGVAGARASLPLSWRRRPRAAEWRLGSSPLAEQRASRAWSWYPPCRPCSARARIPSSRNGPAGGLRVESAASQGRRSPHVPARQRAMELRSLHRAVQRDHSRLRSPAPSRRRTRRPATA